jgi:hypothetical protein
MLLTGYMLMRIQGIWNCMGASSKHIPINFITRKEKGSKIFGDFVTPNFDMGNKKVAFGATLVQF